MNYLLARFIGVPSLLAPDMRDRFEACLNAVMLHERAAELLEARASADDGFWPGEGDWRRVLRPYVVRDGILHIPVKGVLLHEFPWAFGGYATGYIYIARALERGLSDPDVRAIALVVDSFGGEVAGCFELTERIFAGRGVKPIRAFAHEVAYSAGYAVACAAGSVSMSRTGGVGSIGVVTAHVDISRAMDEMGVKVTFIFAGKHKVDGNPYEPLPDDVKRRVQLRIDDLYGIFVANVARYRGLTEGAVRSTEALCYGALEAKSVGLVDSIGPFDDEVAAFAADLSMEHDGEDEMDPKDTSAAKPAAESNTKPATAATPAAAPPTPAIDAAAVTSQATAAERTRVSGILGCEETKGREGLAQHLAFSTDMSVDAAKAMLAKAPVQAAAPAAPENPLAAAMAGLKNPTIGPNNDAGGKDDLTPVTSMTKQYLGDRASGRSN